MEHCDRHQIPFESGSYCPGCVAAVALFENAHELETPFSTLGDYELIRELGRGGMGVVYLARQKGLNRRVALKLLPSGDLAGNELIQRFQREGELAASLCHPNIVRIFEAGKTDDELFYSMELISGGSLADWREGKTQRPANAAALLRTLALAVAHAHEHGILHRDLKPSNILIDEDGNPKVADFGLARPVDTAGDLTLTTHSFGSPAYMAPELIRDSKSATAMSDVYSLGAILYFLLSGRSPFVSAFLDEMLRQVRECEPIPPRLTAPSIPLDLQKVCLKALDKNPAKRYASALEFSEDLGRFIDGRPVLARPAGPALKAYRLAKRAPWLTAAVAAFTLTLIGGVVGIAWWAKVANERADEIAHKSAKLRINLYSSDIATASLAVRRGDTPLAAEILSRWDSTPADDDPRGFEWQLLKLESLPTAHRLIDQRGATITNIAYSSDGRHLAIADQSGILRIPDVDGEQSDDFPVLSGDDVAALPASLGGGWAVGNLKEIRWLGPASREIAKTDGAQFSLSTQVTRAIIANTPRFHWWVNGGPAFVFDWKTGKRILEIPGEWRQAVISPDGRIAALADVKGGLKLITIDTGEVRDLPCSSPVWALSFSADGRKLSAGTRTSAIIWTLDNGSPPLVLPHGLTVWMTAFSADGSHFLTASSDRRVRVWRTDHPADPPLILSGHRSEVWCAAFSPDGKTVAAGGKDGSVLSWKINTPVLSPEPIAHDLHSPPFFTPDGTALVHHQGNRSYMRNLQTGSETSLPEGVTALGISSDGRGVNVVDRNGSIGRASFFHPEEIRLWQMDPPQSDDRMLLSLCGGRWVSRVLANGEINLVNPANGKIAVKLPGPFPGMRHLVTGNEAGTLIAVGGDGQNSLVLHDLSAGRAVSLEPASSYYYVSAGFSPDGNLLAGGDLSGLIRVWDVRTRCLLATLPGHPEETSSVTFSPEGKTLASLGYHQDLKLWNVATWRELHSISIPDAAYNLIFSPDGGRLIVTMGETKNEWIECFPALENH